MAGAGYKLFTTGSVLTAAEVNTYLNEQTVMVFNDATARTTALSGVLAEGMVTYLKSTKVVEIYNGTAWASLDDPNAIQNTIVDAKGDLITATASDVPARLAVGNNGETLVADSSATTGLRWGNNYGFTAGKNKIINGDFNINQRSFSSTTTSGTFGFDRWFLGYSGGTVTYSTQAFTAGAAPVAGYESTRFARLVSASQSAAGDYATLQQKIEDVRTFAGQTIVYSFWAKAASGTPNVGITLVQNFGSGGSAGVVTSPAVQAISTSWARYSFVVNVPSVSGKTIGTSSALETIIFTSNGATLQASGYAAVGVQNATIDIWGVQAEIGSVATAFQTATGTLAGELYACKRYYQLLERNTSWYVGQAYSGTEVIAPVRFETEMRTSPTIVLGTAGKAAGQWSFLTSTAGFATTVGSHSATNINKYAFELYASGYGASTFTAGNASLAYTNGVVTVYTASAEL